MNEGEKNIIHEQELKDLESFFSKVCLPIAPVNLDTCSRIIDVSLFISSHISIVRFQIRNDRYKPYLDRLLLFKDQIIKSLINT